MTSKGKHQKHPPMKRPSIGNYHRCEWGIYGTGCSDIEAFYQELDSYLSPTYRTAYVDADHSDNSTGQVLQVGKKIFSTRSEKDWNEYDDKLFPLASDAVFINGNHFPADRQIVFLNPKKEASLERRKDQLTDIRILIKDSEDQEIYGFLKDKITEGTKVFTKIQITSIKELIKEDISSHRPKVKALILAGGKSTRMGSDKSQLVYDGIETQELKMAKLCASLGLESHISKGSYFSEENIEGVPVIKDRLTDMGPFGAIVSAFMHDPDSAWLVLACDLPFINKDSLSALLARRYSSGVATAFKAQERPFPEPLITIYEPRAYGRFLEFMSLGYSCPRKVIINSDVRVLGLEDTSVIENVNTPEDLEKARNRMSQSNG